MKKAIPFGKYDLLERINVGGMAEVFRAKTYGVEGFERLVAVKKILPNIAEDKEFTTMFVDEAKIAGMLSHANIAQIFDLGVVDGSYFIALEHVHGRDLRAIFDRCRSLGGPMPVAQACFVIMKLCEGLDYAHNKRDQGGRDMNLVHRDVSPQNVIVSFEGEIKIIDFGIAKAAGKAGKTQAGILKGKFGYMSPEQVRGLPIDRRSDIFATGIVLYELLTNERLFIGETDFSTLEKVRNVEILPPSTYNRKIPDELERIVLKALARDMDDRYANAIDLHDELQAFVYTAGEFYSRKDLAAWMKRTFAKEIEEETARIDAYRQLPPSTPRQDGETVQGRTSPPQRANTIPRSTTRPPTRPPLGGAPPSAPNQKITQGIRKATISMPAAVPPPSPPAALAPLSQKANGRSRPTRPPFEEAQPTPTSPPPPMMLDAPEPEPESVDATPAPPPPVAASAAKPAAQPADRPPRRGDLEWDDEELETQIYDNVSGPQAAVAAAVAAKDAKSGPMRNPSRPSAATPAFVTAPTVPHSDNVGTQAPKGAFGPSAATAPEKRRDRRPRASANGSSPAFNAPREPSMTARGTIIPEIHVRRPPSPAKMWLVAALGAVVVAALIIAGHWVFSGDSGAVASKPSAAPRASNEPAPAAAAAPLPVDPSSGFDITTDPPGGKVRLDGNEIGNAPLRVRSLLAGKHTLEIGGVAGYQTSKQDILVEQGKAATLAFKLDKIGAAPSTPAAPVSSTPIVVKLTSEPPAAKVTLVVDGARTILGVTPTEIKVDPSRRSEVTFELPGHAPVTKSIGASDTTIAAVLVPERATMPPAETPAPAVVPPKEIAAPTPARRPEPQAAPPRRPPPRREPEERRPSRREPIARDPEPRETTPSAPRETTPGPRVVEVAPAGNGKLTLGAKPPCSVIVDGRDTGKTTPVRDLELPAGAVQVTLVNAEFGIKESFTVNVKPGETTKVIKDFSDRLPK